MVRRGLDMIVIGLDADHIDRAKPDATLGNDLICERVDRSCRPAQHHGFERRLMIENDVRRRDDESVVIVLDVAQPLRQRAGTVVVDVAEAGDARSAPSLGKPLLVDQLTHQVTYRL